MALTDPMRVLICGDRNWTDREMIAGYLERLKARFPSGLEICHGAARGADRIAGEEAQRLGIPVTPFPADWKRYGKAAGPIRNRQMLKEFRPHVVHAFHDSLETSRGTKDMVNAAIGQGIGVNKSDHSERIGYAPYYMPPYDLPDDIPPEARVQFIR